MTRTKVIVVDDDRETREVLALALSMEGFEVSHVANGLRLISTLQVDQPDVILLDVNMSWIDGFELCRSIKQNEDFQSIPVIFITARTSPADVKRGYSVGAAGYFTKPLDIPALVGKLRELTARPQEA